MTVRFVAADGCFNFRDLGGYRTSWGTSVAWGRLYRADALHRLSPGGRAVFDGLGLARVLDLRTAQEVARSPWTPPDAWAGERRHLPLFTRVPDWTGTAPEVLEGPRFAADHYWDVLAEGGPALRTAIETMAAPGGLPAVFHCAAGKDRTGILAALVLRLLGVPAEVVADDYALSEQATARWEASVAGGGDDDTKPTWAYVPPSLMRADRATMLAFLERVDAEYGSVERLVSGMGIGVACVDALRRGLTEG
ncbi:tyrosine-protein phosphatase [Streptomyces sp. NPDC002523]